MYTAKVDHLLLPSDMKKRMRLMKIRHLRIVAEVGGRHARALFEKSAEVGGFGKPQFVADFFGRKVAEIQQSFGYHSNAALEVFFGRFSAVRFDHPVEVIRGDV